MVLSSQLPKLPLAVNDQGSSHLTLMLRVVVKKMRDVVQTKCKKKEDQVANTVADLKRRHGDSYIVL